MLHLKRALVLAGFFFTAANGAAFNPQEIKEAQHLVLQNPQLDTLASTPPPTSAAAIISESGERVTVALYSSPHYSSPADFVVAKFRDQVSAIIQAGAVEILGSAPVTYGGGSVTIASKIVSITADGVISIGEDIRIALSEVTTPEGAGGHPDALRKRDSGYSAGAPMTDISSVIRIGTITAAVSVIVYVFVIVGCVLLAVLRK